MQAYQIIKVKEIMNAMLRNDTFDSFLVSDITIKHQISYVIDGHMSSLEDADAIVHDGMPATCISYGKVRNICFEMMKGKTIPSYFKFIFLLPPDQLASLLESTDTSLQTSDIANLSLNLRFQDNVLLATAGTSVKMFTTDKTLDKAWDEWVSHFLEPYQLV